MSISGVPELHSVAIPTDLDGASAGLLGVVGIPAGPGPWPGIVVVHEAFGITDAMRKHVERLVASGFIVVMPDLFSQGGARKCLVATFRALMNGEGRAFQDIEAARRMLVGRSDCTGAVGVIGFCMGGGFALLTAARGFDVASANYGMLPKDLDSAIAGACPIIGSYGKDDRTLPGAAAKLEEALDRAGIPHEVTEYPGAGHSFLNDDASGPVILRPLLRVMNLGPKPEQAAEAWQRIDAFFERYLTNPAQQRP